MNTIRQLAMEWWNNLLPIADSETLNKTALCEQYYGFERTHQSLTGREIENIFYNEVIVKWWDNLENKFDVLTKYYPNSSSIFEKGLKEI